MKVLESVTLLNKQNGFYRFSILPFLAWSTQSVAFCPLTLTFFHEIEEQISYRATWQSYSCAT